MPISALRRRSVTLDEVSEVILENSAPEVIVGSLPGRIIERNSAGGEFLVALGPSTKPLIVLEEIPQVLKKGEEIGWKLEVHPDRYKRLLQPSNPEVWWFWWTKADHVFWPYAKTSTPLTKDLRCIHCGEANSYAEPNMGDGSFLCYTCSSTELWRSKYRALRDQWLAKKDSK